MDNGWRAAMNAAYGYAADTGQKFRVRSYQTIIGDAVVWRYKPEARGARHGVTIRDVYARSYRPWEHSPA